MTQKIVWDRSERASAGGRRRAGSAMYERVPEESEHRRALQKQRRRKSSETVASERLPVAAGAQDPQCTNVYLRNPSTAGRRQTLAQ